MKCETCTIQITVQELKRLQHPFVKKSNTLHKKQPHFSKCTSYMDLNIFRLHLSNIYTVTTFYAFGNFDVQ